MYAAQKYSATDRIATSQEWAQQYPDRVPTIISSPHWPFYTFKCLLLPKDMPMQEVCALVHRNWSHKFPSNATQLVLKVAPGTSRLDVTQALNGTATCDEIARTYLATDGLLYLTAHTIS